MKYQDKIYEDVFSVDREKITTPLRVENLSAVGMDFDKYTSFFHSFLKDFYDDLFLKCVKLSWLRRKFVFYGHKFKIPGHERNSIGLHIAFHKFTRRIIGNDIQMITKSPFFTKLEICYFDLLFPGFDDGDPFENPEYYKFPYKNISMEFLIVVYQLDKRLELLKHANENKMSFAVFLDFVNNYVLSENDRIGREKYTLKDFHRGRDSKIFYVCDNDKIYNFSKKKNNGKT